MTSTGLLPPGGKHLSTSLVAPASFRPWGQPNPKAVVQFRDLVYLNRYIYMVDKCI